MLKKISLCLIFGEDWIASSETNLVVRGGKLVLEGKGRKIKKKEESKGCNDCIKCEEVRRKKKMKKVRFADEVEDMGTERLSVSDELILICTRKSLHRSVVVVASLLN